MHILIIPSEEYIPTENSIQGIFQKDQAEILHANGHKTGIISVSMKFSLLMLLKGLVYRIIRKKLQNELDEKKISFILRTLINKTLFPWKYVLKETLNKIPVIRIESYHNLHLSEKSSYNGWLRGGYLAFKEYIKLHGKPDVIHAHNMMNAGFLANKIKNKYNIPIFVTEHSSSYSQNKLSPFILNKINSSFYEMQELLVVSNSLGEIIQGKLSNLKRYKMLPNVLDRIFMSTPFVKNKHKNDFVFINVGSFLPIKGQISLIKAFSSQFKRKSNIKLKIIGGGELYEDLQKTIINECVENQVIIIKHISRLEIIKHLDNSDIFVFSSISETFGVAVIEALSRGLPVLSTKSGGPESIINDSNGILVENTTKSIAEGMLNIKENIVDYNKEFIKKDCFRKYSPEAFYSNLMSCYKTI